MYSATLAFHSWLRWAVLLLGLVAVGRARAASSTGRWSRADDRAALFFSVAFDVQFLVGLVLYLALSPATAAAMHDFGAAMRTASVRYWAVEHETGMILALVLTHVGRVRIRRVTESRKGRVALIFFAIALLLIVASTPWPGMPNGRPWLRMP